MRRASSLLVRGVITHRVLIHEFLRLIDDVETLSFAVSYDSYDSYITEPRYAEADAA